MRKVISVILIITMIISMCSGAIYADEVVFEGEEVFDGDVIEEETIFEEPANWDEEEYVTDGFISSEEETSSVDSSNVGSEYIWEDYQVKQEVISDDSTLSENEIVYNDDYNIFEDDVISENVITDDQSYDYIEDSGICGKNLKWSISGERFESVLNIYGNGSMDDYDNENRAPWWDRYSNQIKSVEISDGITSIGDCAFYYLTNMSTITIADSVTSIGENAFSGCRELQNITLPKSLTSIGPKAFQQCSSLTQLIIPYGVKNIGYYAFVQCDNLTSITIPKSVKDLIYPFYETDNLTIYCEKGSYAEIYARNNNISYKYISESGDVEAVIIEKGTCGENLVWSLDEDGILSINGTGEMYDYGIDDCIFGNQLGGTVDVIKISEGVTSVGNYAFNYCYSRNNGVVTVILPSTLRSIGIRAFYNCHMYDIGLPDGLQIINEGAFANANLRKIIIPSGLEELPDNCFYGCYFEKIVIPENIKKIDYGAFASCRYLSDVTIEGTEIEMSDMVFHNCELLLSAGPIGGEYNIKYGWDKKIPDYAFSNSCITDVAFSDSISAVGWNAFSGCQNLEKIKLPSNIIDIGAWAFTGSEKLKSAGPMGGGYNIEYEWDKSIPPNAFVQSSIETIVLPEGIENIGHYAFSSTNIREVVLPSSLVTIGYNAFSSCKDLCKVKILCPEEQIDFQDKVFADCANLKTAGPIGSGSDIEFVWTERIPDNTFYSCASLEQATFPDTIIQIGDHSFYKCSTLKQLMIPEGVERVGYYAFGDCSRLDKVTLPSTLSDIGKECDRYAWGSIFSGCDLLKTAGAVGTGANIEFAWKDSVPDYVFYDCKSLTDVIIPDGISSIGSCVFCGCSNLEYLVIPESVKYISSGAFLYPRDNSKNNCTKLMTAGSIGSGSNIEFGWEDTIPKYAFYYQSSMQNIVLPKSVKKIGDYAFTKCKELTDVYYEGTESQWNQIEFGKDVLKDLGNITIHYNYKGSSDTSSKKAEGILREGDGWAVKWKITYNEDNSGKKTNGKLSIYLEGSNKEYGNIMLYSNIDNGISMPWLTTEFGFNKNDIIEVSINGGYNNLFTIIPNQFSEYNNLARVHLEKVSGIEGKAFADCQKLISVSYDNTLKTIADGAFKNDKKLDTFIALNDKSSILSIGDEAFYLTTINSFNFTGVKSIGARAFYNTKLTRIELSRTINPIGENAFFGCKNCIIYCYSGSYAHEYAIANNIQVFLFDTIYASDTPIYLKDIIGNRSFESYVASVDSNIYNPELAYMLAGLSRAVYTDSDIKNSMVSLGYDWEKNCYYDLRNDITAGYTIAKKDLDDGTVFVIIVVRGSWHWSWISNAVIGPAALAGFGKHLGFEEEATEVFESLKKLIGGLKTAGIRYVITGHSQGGAVANLLSVKLRDEGVPSSLVYDYNFACPNVASLVNPLDFNPNGAHNNIFNIGNEEDLVPYVPSDYLPITLNRFSSWGKFGQSFWFTPNEDNRSPFGHDMKFYMKALSPPYLTRDKLFPFSAIPAAVLIRVFDIHCPVDVIISDPQGKKIAGVIENQCVYYDKENSHVIVVANDDDKSVYIYGNDEYHVDLVATDRGEMSCETYTVDLINAKTYQEESYKEVQLEKGKLMAFDSDEPNKSVSLLVVDEDRNTVAKVENDGCEVLVQPTPSMNKKNNPLKVECEKVSIGLTKINDNQETISKAVTVTDTQGKLTFTKESGSDNLSISEDGIITVKKGTKAGTYEIIVRVTAAGNDLYKPGSKTVTVTISVIDDRSVQPMTVSTKTGYAKRTKLKSKSQSIKNTISVNNAQGKVTFSKVSGSDKLTINKAGTITVKKGTKNGTYTIKVKVKAAGNDQYKAGAKKVTVKVVVKDDRKKQPMTVAVKNPSVKASKLKKNKKTFTKAGVFTVKKARGSVTFKKVSGSKNLTISKAGKITVKKGTKKGTYKIKVAVTAAGNDNYKAGTKNVTVKVVVK